jgi:hypothetical protein
MKRIVTTIALIVLLIAAASEGRAFSPEDLVGTWRLLSTVRQVVGSDKVVNNLGAHPNGVMIITPEHRFIIIETGADRHPAKTTEEFAALQKSELAFSGLATFSPDPDNPQGLRMVSKVDISWNEEWTGTSQTRLLSLDDNRLTIRTLPSKNPYTGEVGISTLVFERSK